MEFLELIQKRGWAKLLLSGNFGLEKENVRTDKQGQIALTPHPEIFGDKARHPYITTDFAESQMELVTPTFDTPEAALNFMEALHDLVSLELEHELLWPYSLPPVLPSEDSLIKEAQFTDPEITEYREYLAHKYGKRKQLLSGVHFNFSFSDKFLHLLYCARPDNWSFREFRDQVYLKVARYYLKYCWLIIYLTGSNSVAHESYIACSQRDKQQLTSDSYLFPGASSFRNGVSGYRNLHHFYVSYNSLYEYIASIRQAIAEGHIIAAKEYYSQLRLKGQTKGGILEDLYHNGINYIEIRTLDLNPLVKVGITQDSLDLIHLLLVYALVAPDFSMSDDDYRLSNLNQILAADANRHQPILLHVNSVQQRPLTEWALELLTTITTTLSQLDLPPAKLAVLDAYRQQLIAHTPSVADQLVAAVRADGYSNYFITQAKHYLNLSQEEHYKFKGFEDLELSTQILLKEAIKYGIKFNFLDRHDNFVELTNGQTRQIVKQATKTVLDNYVTIMAMENKIVTKSMVAQHKITVPQGASYTNLTEAQQDFPLFAACGVVIKPNSTNFGIGVHLLKAGFSYNAYCQALAKAFSYDSKVIVEELVTGKEYRFFVIDGQAVAILHREPANVVGDGVHSIRELVELKNQDPLRGIGYVKPLEQLRLDEVELAFLADQGLTAEFIPEAKEKVYLRENSNISTGGDSIDYTERMPKAYKRIAVKAAASVGAVICGVDMIIRDIGNPYPENNYSIIELNFNPAIHIHTYPYQGKDRKLAKRILTALNLIGG